MESLHCVCGESSPGSILGAEEEMVVERVSEG